MSDTNPPKERTSDHDVNLSWWESGEELCESVGAETARLIARVEPDANRRAALWLIGRRWIEVQYDENDPEGARAMQHWVRKMLTPPQPE